MSPSLSMVVTQDQGHVWEATRAVHAGAAAVPLEKGPHPHRAGRYRGQKCSRFSRTRDSHGVRCTPA